MTGVEAASLEVKSQYADGYYTADLAQINISTSAKGVKDGSVRGLVVGTLHGSTAALPIRLQVNISISTKVVKEGTIGGAIVKRIADPYANWEVNCSISIERMLGGSSLLGIVVEVKRRHSICGRHGRSGALQRERPFGACCSNMEFTCAKGAPVGGASMTISADTNCFYRRPRAAA